MTKAELLKKQEKDRKTARKILDEAKTSTGLDFSKVTSLEGETTAVKLKAFQAFTSTLKE